MLLIHTHKKNNATVLDTSSDLWYMMIKNQFWHWAIFFRYSLINMKQLHIFFNCNKVTQKTKWASAKTKPLLTSLSTFFPFNDFKFEYSRPPVLPKERRAISAKKRIVRYGSAWPAPKTVPGTEHFRTIFSAAHRTLLGRLRHQYQFL